MKLLMCAPDYYGIEYEINPWMDVTKKANLPLAVAQWQHLYQTLLTLGVTVELIPQAKGWPDMVFTANGGLLYQGKIVLPHFKYKERQGESAYFRTWFIQAGYAILNDFDLAKPNIPFFEGAGDALLAGDTLFVGYGMRSNKEFFEQAPYLDQRHLVYCELVDPYYYHIDTCFCPLNDKQAIWFPPAFSKESQARMENAIELIEVKASEARHFACNAVVVNKNIVIPQNCPDLTSTLEALGINVYACDMMEYIKSGGACKCLTLVI